MNMNPQGGVVAGAQRPNAGIDVSKQHLDVCLEAEDLRVDNDARGWEGLTAKLKDAGVDLVVIEATGGYERAVVCALQGAGIAVRVNPRQSHDFAKSMGVLAKTDKSMPACCATLPMYWRATGSAPSTSPRWSRRTAPSLPR